MQRRPSLSICATLFFAAAQAGAVELADGRLSLNGFGQWTFSNVTHDNGYGAFAPGADFTGASVALALHASLLERGHVALQVRFDSDAHLTTLDWAFGEWRFSDQLRLRVGLVQHPFGISGDVRDVGTVRPFLLLPSSIYGSADITGEAIEGASLNGAVFSASGWSLQYDAYFGALDIPSTSPYPKLLAGYHPGGLLETTIETTNYLAGGRLILSPSIEGVTFRLSAYSSVRNLEDLVVGPSLRYLGNGFDIRAEYFFHFEGANPSRTQAAYVEAAYMLTGNVQAGLRGEIYRGELIGYTGSRDLLEHRELAATLNYWFAPGFVLKLSAHLIDGNRFAFPTMLDDAVLAGTLQRQTMMVIAGTQFSF